ncbi:unnamed protein product [Thlaspi arvense]|uniref:Pectinesterase inhibitor domain-containing protein n=1 Tax=Thlaspi arvense TaxID=13288 RepID=A0AAU9TDT1_THLAR|nr:unnamed protein product [Thlaspi arvense]
MASLSSSFVVIFMSILLQFLIVSASRKHIDDICQHVTDKAFCVKTLTAYPPVVAATVELKAVKAVLNLAKSYAKKSMKFSLKMANKNPKLKKQFMECQDSFQRIVLSFASAAGELNESSETANYDVMVCTDQTRLVEDSIGKNRDEASKAIMSRTMMMNGLIAIADAATDLIDTGYV